MKFTNLLPVFLILGFSPQAFAATETITIVEDSYVRETSPSKNYGTETTLIADGVAQDPDTGTYGEVVALIQWDVSSIPASATVTGVSVTLNYSDASAGPYNFYAQNKAWSEGSVSWDDLDQGVDILGTVDPFTFNTGTHSLNGAGIALVQGWVDGSISNNGLLLRSSGTNNGIVMDSKEAGGTPPTLEITYTDDGSEPPTINQLLTRIEQLEALLAGISRNGNEIYMDGINLNIRNGLGATNGYPENPDGFTPEYSRVNGLGNLIIGYNEPINPNNFPKPQPTSDKSGSHNLVIGHGHNYPSYGGLVAGQDNIISGSYTSVSGGVYNTASGIFSSIDGGALNITSGRLSNVSGGTENISSGHSSSVSGGRNNTASGIWSSISGGNRNVANEGHSSVSGGNNNTASGDYSSISGGHNNTASGGASSVSGGSFNEASGGSANISGGLRNIASGGNSSVSGGGYSTASGSTSSVSGGNSRLALNASDWVAGSLFEDF